MPAPLPLVESFATIEDPRHGALYPLPEIMVLTVCAVISGADTFVAVEQFGKARLAWLRRLLPFERGTPSHDTLGRVFALIDPDAFEQCFQAWTHHVAQLTDGEVIALDGKTLRGSYDRASDQAPLHLVEAWASEQHLTLGQRRSAAGANEIETIPRLLEMLVLDGCIVTLDAMGCQVDIAAAILDAGADYVLQVKANQRALHADLRQFFDRHLRHGQEADVREVDGGHGRVEVRRCWAVEVAGQGWIDTARWPRLRSIAMIESERFEVEPGRGDGPACGKTSKQRRYVISSLPGAAERLLEATRRHWHIENRLHWTMDVVFGEDRSRVRRPEAAENLARVRRLAHSILRRDDRVKGGVQTKRMRAGWDPDYLEHLLGHL